MDKINAEVFLTVAERESFRKAADLLGYTQAGISYIVANMEKETGLTLFVREHNGVRLSEEGKALLPEIEELAIWERRFRQTVDELNGLKRGSIRVQIFDSISIHWVPGIVRRFHDDYPGIDIELISEENSTKVEEMVSRGEIDCGFFLKKSGSDIESFPLVEENLMAVVPIDHPLAELDKFPLAELDKHPFISMKYDPHNGIWNIFKKRKVRPNVAFFLDNDYAALAMVRQGLGYCIFPELLLRDMPAGLKKMEFDVPQKRGISVGTASMRTCSKACRKFIEYTIAWVENDVKKQRR